MEFDINFGNFCYNCGGKCCEQNNWWLGSINSPRLAAASDLRDIENDYNLPLVLRNDWGMRCLHFNNQKCEIYENRPDACKDYICNNPIFGILDEMMKIKDNN